MSPLLASATRQTLKGAIRIFIAEFLIFPTGLLTIAFLTRQLGPTNFGLFVLASSVITWIEWTITSFFVRATIRLVGEDIDWKPSASTATQLQFLFGCLATVLVLLLADILATLFNEPSLALYLRLFSLDIPLFCLAQAHREVLVGIGAFGGRAFMSAGRWLSRLALIVILVGMDLSVPGAILGSIGASFLEIIIARIYVRPKLFSEFSQEAARRLKSYAAPLFLFAVCMRLYDKVDLFLLKLLGGSAEQAAIYGGAQNLALLPGLLTLSLSPLVLSTLSRLLKEKKEAQAKEVIHDAWKLLILLLPFAALISATAPEIVPWILGDRFLPSAKVLAILVFSAFSLTVLSINTAILTASGNPRLVLRVTVPLLPLAVTGHLIVIPLIGILGAALVTTSFAALGAIGSVWTVSSVWRIRPSISTIVRSLIISGIIALSSHFWSTTGGLVLLKLMILSSLILASFILLGELRHKEIKTIQSFLRRKDSKSNLTEEG